MNSSISEPDWPESSGICMLFKNGPLESSVKLLPKRFRSAFFRKIVLSPELDRMPMKDERIDLDCLFEQSSSAGIRSARAPAALRNLR